MTIPRHRRRFSNTSRRAGPSTASLSFVTSSQDTLRGTFLPRCACPDVESCWCCRYAYVEFAEPEFIDAALAMDNSLFRGRLIKVSCFVSECLPTTNTPACTGDTKKDKHSWFQSWTRAWWRIPWRISGRVPGRLIRIYSLPCAWQVGSQTILARVLSLTWIKIVGAAVGATNYSKRTSNLWLALYSLSMTVALGDTPLYFTPPISTLLMRM